MPTTDLSLRMGEKIKQNKSKQTNKLKNKNTSRFSNIFTYQ